MTMCSFKGFEGFEGWNYWDTLQMSMALFTCCASNNLLRLQV